MLSLPPPSLLLFYLVLGAGRGGGEGEQGLKGRTKKEPQSSRDQLQVAVCEYGWVCHDTHVDVRGQSQSLPLILLGQCLSVVMLCAQAHWLVSFPDLSYLRLLSYRRSAAVTDVNCHVLWGPGRALPTEPSPRPQLYIWISSHPSLWCSMALLGVAVA